MSKNTEKYSRNIIEDITGINLLAVEEDKIAQIIHYRLQVTSTVVNPGDFKKETE